MSMPSARHLYQEVILKTESAQAVEQTINNDSNHQDGIDLLTFPCSDAIEA
jgi:hypothetical protein